jgi:hypothetical protein
MISKGMVEDSITRLPKNHKMQKECRRYFLAVKTASPNNPIIRRMATKVSTGENRAYESGKS